MQKQTSKSPRISVCLPPNAYQEIMEMAQKHNLSASWIARQAIMFFLDDNREGARQLPLPLEPKS